MHRSAPQPTPVFVVSAFVLGLELTMDVVSGRARIHDLLALLSKIYNKDN